MKPINVLINKMIDLQASKDYRLTLLAVCPNSEAVLEAAVKSAAMNRSIMLFAATLNQVDLDGGYTGWTPAVFVDKLHHYTEKYAWEGALYPCLDHGGPWLKDKDTQEGLDFEETFQNVKNSIAACVRAGYALLHIDPTVDRTLQGNQTITIETVVERTVTLISYAERIRISFGLPEISYEVGTEEVHGGMVDLGGFEKFIHLLRDKMEAAGLSYAWPSFFVAQVGTDLHTTHFDENAAIAIHDKLAPTGALAKGHYSDWVAKPEAYPRTGMGGANVGPEFTAEEFLALRDLTVKESVLGWSQKYFVSSGFMEALQNAVVSSGRWKKWLQTTETDLDFDALQPERQLWLLQTGSRYIWTEPEVEQARKALYDNLSGAMIDPHQYVVDRIARSIDKYITHFNLYNSTALLV